MHCNSAVRTFSRFIFIQSMAINHGVFNIADGVPNWTHLNRNNSAADCSISLKFGRPMLAHYGSAEGAELLSL